MSHRKFSLVVLFAVLLVSVALSTMLAGLVYPDVNPMRCNQGIFEKIFNNESGNGCNREAGLFYFNPDTLGIEK